MHPVAHHTGEQTLAPLLLLAGGGVSLLVAIGRARLTAARTKLTRKQGSRREAEMEAREPTRTPASRHGGNVRP
jgi:hypothetical protein